MNLEQLGWNREFRLHFERLGANGLMPARVARQDRRGYLLYCLNDILTASLTGRMRRQASGAEELPAVGDWVAVERERQSDQATIRAILPRRSCFVRQAAGAATAGQVIAANIDTVFLVSGLDGDHSPRRLERYLALAYESGANPVILLNKADICPNLGRALDEARDVALGAPVHPISATERQGVELVRQYVTAGQTAALLGSSGVGKSTLLNALLGEERQVVRAVREGDSKGRHTTTNRELFLLPDGGVIIDTPGMRELQLWSGEEALTKTFQEIDELADRCRFRDCGHESEPGCAVQAAIQRGELSQERWLGYGKLKRETERLTDRRAYQARREQQAKGYRDLLKRAKRTG